jgi:hypothetical protein
MPAQLPATPPAAANTSILDQLPELRLAVRGRPVAELLRPAYDSFAGPRL